MYLLGEQSLYNSELISASQQLPSLFLAGLEPSGPALSWSRWQPELQDHDTVYLITQGALAVTTQQRPIFRLECGDVIGLLPNNTWEYLSDQPITLTPYNRSALFQHISAKQPRIEQVAQYLNNQLSMLSEAVASLRQPDTQPKTGYLSLDSGETLIQQGETSDTVYILLQGHAEVHVDGEKVGEIFPDEIVGAMAAITKQTRSATVKALSPCTLLTIPQDQFLALLQTSPRIASTLVSSMAERINQLNREVANFKQTQREEII